MSGSSFTRAVAIRFGLFAAAAPLLLTACVGASESDEATVAEGGGGLSGQVVWADFGGPTNEARQEIYFDDFTAETGVKVISEVEADAIANAMMAGEDGEYDAMHVGLDHVYANKENLAELTPDVARDENLPEDIRDYAFGTFFVGHAMGYLTETFPDGGPQTWADFWDTEKFPGKRAWAGAPGSYDSSAEIALMADGVAAEDLYPLDLERAGRKLDELRGDMVFYQSYPEIQTLLTSGTAAIAMGPSGQYSSLINAGEDVTISWNQAMVAPNVMTIGSKAPNLDNIMALADFFNDPQRQADFAARTGYGPGNPDAFDLMDDATKAKVVNAPEHTDIVVQNMQARAAQSDEMLDWYTEWLSKG